MVTASLLFRRLPTACWTAIAATTAVVCGPWSYFLCGSQFYSVSPCDLLIADEGY